MTMFTPLSVEERLRNIVGRPLALWIIAAAAATPEEIEEGKESWPPKKTTRLYAWCIWYDA
uniref:Uncharacterized protein n=1 Tax=Hyaloperonospora arabidopsidis (strain Emoy2) TaxID=559515 RepID=M4B6Z8_HYAAE